MGTDPTLQHYAELFLIRDINEDGLYFSDFECTAKPGDRRGLMSCMEKREIGLMNDKFYQVLDAHDDVKGNGFSLYDFKAVTEYYGLKGLSQFYPYYRFQYYEGCDCIGVDTQDPILTTSFPDDNADVQLMTGRVFSSAIAAGILGALGGEVIGVELLETNVDMVVVEDVHYQHESTAFLVGVVESALATREMAVLFRENASGPVICDEAYAEEVWGFLKGMIMVKEEATRHGIARLGQSPQQILESPSGSGGLEILEGHIEELLKKVSYSELAGIDFSHLKEILEKYPDLKAAILAASPELYIKAVYGNRVLILNPEAKGPLNLTGSNNSQERIQGVSGSQAARDYFSTQLSLSYTREKIGHEAEKVLLSKAVIDSVEGFYKAMDDRTDLWIQNIIGILTDPDLPHITGGAPLIVFSGGGVHTKRLIDGLRGQVSTLVLKPKGIY